VSKKKKTIEELMEGELVPEDEQPYKVPENWVWINSGHILNFIGGGTPSKSNSDFWNGNIPWATVKDIKNRYLSSTIDYITVEGLENSSATMASPNELLLITRMSPGKSTITKISTTINQDLKIVRPKIEILPYFLWLFFTVNTSLIESLSTGSTVKGIQVEKLKKISFPVPPVNEQKRIAEKVQRLLSKIEEAKQLIEETKETFELRRASILDKAFRGELGTNDNEEKNMIDELGRAKIIPIQELPYEVPENWVWTRIDDIFEIENGDRSSNYPKNAELVEEGVPFISTKNLIDNQLDISNLSLISQEKFDSLRSGKLKNCDLIMSLRGSIGKVGVFTETEDYKTGFINAQLVILRMKSKFEINNIFFYQWYMSSKFFQNQLTKASTGSAQPQLSASELKKLIVPLPPNNEQKRIIDKIDSLLKKSQIQQKIIGNITVNIEAIKQSILSKAVRGELGTNDPSEENAIELLKEVLQEQVK
jgi:type I restriction enzyme, S subunit